MTYEIASYEVVKSLHIVAFVCWFAGLFYLPRLFVYHAANKKHEQITDLFKVMERKLYKYITTPSMVITVAMGAWLIHLNPEWLKSGGWLHAKLLLVALLVVYHFSLGYYLKKFAKDENAKSEKFFRIYNEVTGVLLLGIIFLAVMKPF